MKRVGLRIQGGMGARDRRYMHDVLRKIETLNPDLNCIVHALQPQVTKTRYVNDFIESLSGAAGIFLVLCDTRTHTHAAALVCVWTCVVEQDRLRAQALARVHPTRERRVG